MKSNTITGSFFLVAGLGPLIVYLLLGDVLEILSTLQTEMIASWILLSVPIAFMRTKDAMPTGIGKEMAQIGLLILVISTAGGMVADSFASVGNAGGREAVGRLVWASLFLGLGFTGFGYYLQEFFNRILSGLLGLLGCIGFLAIGIGGVGDDASAEMVWLPFMLIMLVLGVTTLRRAE